MNLTSEVVPAQYTPGCWEAALVIDGTPTTFECTHLHHTERAAAKCLQAVLDRAEAWIADPTFTDTEINAEGLHEWGKVHGYSAAGTPLGAYTRLWMHRNI